MRRIKNLAQMLKEVKKGKYFGDFIIVDGIGYQMVEYSMESYGGKGSRWVTYYNPFTGIQIAIDYAQQTIDDSESVVAWEKDLALDMEWLKKRSKKRSKK